MDIFAFLQISASGSLGKMSTFAVVKELIYMIEEVLVKLKIVLLVSFSKGQIGLPVLQVFGLRGPFGTWTKKSKCEVG